MRSFQADRYTHVMKTINALVMSAAATALLCSVMPAARADDDAKINARIEAWGRNCKNSLAVKFPKASMADIRVELSATLKQSIDAGEITLKEINRSGLSFNWTMKKKSGYCNTDGSGNVIELK